MNGDSVEQASASIVVAEDEVGDLGGVGGVAGVFFKAVAVFLGPLERDAQVELGVGAVELVKDVEDPASA